MLNKQREKDMHLICSYCNRYIKEKKPFASARKTHGICPDCYCRLLRQNEGLSYDDYLEMFPVPVLIVDSRSRVAAANKAALSMLNKPVDRVVGMLGGEALECPHSELPGGCGQTVHCETCTIRKLVTRTMREQTSQHNQRVSVESKNGRADFLISTIYFDNLIQIVFENYLDNKNEMNPASCQTAEKTATGRKPKNN